MREKEICETRKYDVTSISITFDLIMIQKRFNSKIMNQLHTIVYVLMSSIIVQIIILTVNVMKKVYRALSLHICSFL